MPTPKVAATLPFPVGAEARKISGRGQRSRGAALPAILSFSEAYRCRQAREPIGDVYTELLEEAVELARSLGCEIRSRPLGGVGGGAHWVGGRLQIVLDVQTTARRRLAVIADALHGEPRLVRASMSDELAAYLQPRRSA